MEKMNYQRILVLFSVLAVVALAACSSDDAEEFLEDVLPSTMVRVIHLSPDAPEVDIDFKLIEIQHTVVGLAYTEASPYTETSTGTVEVIFKRASDGAEIATIEDPEFSSDLDNTIYVVNEAANLEFVQSQDDRSVDNANAKVRFVHGVFDAPAVDIRTDSADGPVVFPGATFKTVTDYASVPAGDYTLVVTTTGTTPTEVATFEAVTLSAGTVYTVIATGTLDAEDDAPFGARAFVDTGDGNTSVELDIVE